MIQQIPFGRTGHSSSRVIFGAAALGGMKPERAIATLDMILARGLNHIDTAASYGESELRLAPWLKDHRNEVFLATKTGQRTEEEAWAEFNRSLERLQVDQVDLIQMHNLVKPDEWETAMGPNGALKALVRAKDEGLVRFIGVTGHGTYVAEAHLKSLDAYPFDSVLCPYNYTMNTAGPYAEDFERLLAVCNERGVAMQTIKAIAARRWRDDEEEKRYSWYRPIRDVDALTRAVHYTLSRDGLFLNSSSDATLLPLILNAAEGPVSQPDDTEMAADASAGGMEPLFVRDQTDDVYNG